MKAHDNPRVSLLEEYKTALLIDMNKMYIERIGPLSSDIDPEKYYGRLQKKINSNFLIRKNQLDNTTAASK